jgi:hypothetical protein
VNKVRPHLWLLYAGAGAGFIVLVSGALVGLLGTTEATRLVAVVLQTLGASILFPILVSFAYDKVRERWLGDEVWRLFGELSDAGIIRVYRDREFAPGRDNAQTRLSEEFRGHSDGPIYMMGPTLRVFFNPLGPFYRDIETMLRSSNGKVTINALIERPDSLAVVDRTAIEEPNLTPHDKPQTERDADSTIATARNMSATIGRYINLRRFLPAPYCTAIIFPSVAFYSPNILSSHVPARLPMILFRAGSHGYDVLRASFDHLWGHPDTQQTLP